jgi:hypothetical protein
VTWSVYRLCRFRSSFTSRCQICDPTNIRGVAIENPRISLTICTFFTATQRKSARSQIWMLQGKELIILHNLRTEYIAVRSELTYIIGAKAVETIDLESRSGSNLAKYPRFYVRAGKQPAKTTAGQVFGRVWNQTKLNRQSKPGPVANTRSGFTGRGKPSFAGSSGSGFAGSKLVGVECSRSPLWQSGFTGSKLVAVDRTSLVAVDLVSLGASW